MTRKHYEVIAQVLRGARPADLKSAEGGRWLALVSAMGYKLDSMELSFNRQRFEEACLKP